MITRSPSGEVTVRQPGRCLQLGVYLAIACCLWVPALIVVGILVWLDRPAGLVCLTVTVLAVASGCVRAMRMYVRFDDSGVTVRNFWRTHRLSWDEVSHFADGGKDWWALTLVRRSGRPIEATGTTTGTKGIVKSGVLDVIGQVAERYHVGADLGGLSLAARPVATAAADLEDSLPGPQQAAGPRVDSPGERADAQSLSKTSYALSLACLCCAVAALGLGSTDLIAYGILPGYLVVVGMASGGAAAILSSITWFGVVARKSPMAPGAELIRRICRAGQMLGILGFILLAIGSGNGSSV